MTIVPFHHDGLGNSSYLVQVAEGEAIVVDPDRSVAKYLQAAAAHGWHIAAALETHLHADVVSGARELAHATGSRVLASRDGALAFAHEPLDGGDRSRFAAASFEAIASPGHTPEHLAFLCRRQGRPPALFSGGSLIVGGAARTDLLSPGQTEGLTRAQFRTLKRAFDRLPDETVLHPTHGAGSLCSAGEGGELVSTLGIERKRNRWLAYDDEDQFVHDFVAGFPPAPDYFFRLRAVNRAGPQLRSHIAEPRSLTPAQTGRLCERALLVDVRPAEQFMESHIEGSVSNAFRPSFGTWLGWLVPAETTLLLVTGDVPVSPVVEEALLVGYERFCGYLAGSPADWERGGLQVTSSRYAAPEEARAEARQGAAVIDVRERSEFEAGHLEGALNIPLGKLSARLGEVPRDRPLVVHCAAGERSATAVSLLERAGYNQVRNLKGGFVAWQEAGAPVA